MNREILKAAIDKNGKIMQSIVAIEEMSELTKELSKMMRGEGNKDHLLEELADVYIVLEEIQMMYNINPMLLDWKMDTKIKRLELRLSEGFVNDLNEVWNELY